MFRVPFLRNLFLLALVATTCLPLYTLFVLHPSYHEQLISETEEESARFATYLVRSLKMEDVSLQYSNLPSEMSELVRLIKSDRSLLKLRFFSPKGEIIYSTDAEEIGQINDRDYFRKIVAQGRNYSKVVRKNSRTADGLQVNIDVVETYVPFVSAGQFGGAIEVYSDITSRVTKINRLTLHSTLSLIAVALVLMLAISLALHNAARALDERHKAQLELEGANQALERRVAERTSELVEANEQLTDQIAERTLAQMALSNALEDARVGREKLDRILSSVNDGLLVTDSALKVVHMNPAAERLFGVRATAVQDRAVIELPVHDEFKVKLQAYLYDRTGENEFDFEISETDQDERVCQVRISPLVMEGQAKPGAILLIRDITRDREIEKMKSAFLGMAAHELNTPLTNIIGYAELLVSPDTMDSFNRNQVQEFLRVIYDKAFALSRLVDDLLDISRIEAGRSLSLIFRECDVGDLARGVVKSFAGQTEKHSFVTNFPEKPVRITADCGRLEQILNNLLSNAIKYSPSGGLIKVSLELEDGQCRLVVEDEGIGMTPEQLEHIFDRFYRGDSSNTAVQGVGLGMCVAKHIVEAHQGTISVASRLEQGTTVTVVLPEEPNGKDLKT